MQYFTQLKLLIWKNLMLRKRNKLRIAVEILWPAVMFLVLLFLHSLGEREHIPNCYFIRKPMPVAGGTTFFQTLLCALGNMCNTEKNASEPFKGALLTELMNAASKAVQNGKDGGFLRKKPFSFQQKILKDKNYSFLNSGRLQKFLVTNKKKRGEYLQADIVKREDTMKDYFTGTKISNSRNTLQRNEETSKSGNPVTKHLPFIEYFMCGPNVPPITKQYDVFLKVGRKFKKSLIELDPPEWESDTSEFCNNLMRDFESDSSSRIIFRMLKPFLRGKIVYTPNAPVINKIMKKLESDLKIMDKIKDKLTPKGGGKRKGQVKADVKFMEAFSEGLARLFKEKNFTNNDPSEFDNYHLKKLEEFQRLQNEQLNNLVDFEIILKFLDCIDPQRFIPVSNEEEAVEEAKKWLSNERLWALIVFVNISSDADELPPSITYKIRTGSDRTVKTNHLRERVYRPGVKAHPVNDLKYITGGFAYLQSMLEGELIKVQTKAENLPGIYLQQTPYPCHVFDSFRDAIAKTFPMFMIISWVFAFIILIKKIVIEKECYIKESMRILGVHNSQHWIAWFIDAFVPMAIISIFLSIILIKGGIIPKSSILAIWLYLVAFSIPTIALAFLLSTIFFKASYATSASALIFFLLYLPYPPIAAFEEDIDPHLKVFLCIFSNIAFGLGCTWIANMEETGEGAQLTNLDYSPIPKNPITLALMFQMFLLDAFIYFLIAIYIENVFPGGHSIGLPWCYCFTKTYWRGYDEKRVSIVPPADSMDKKDPTRFEKEPEGLKIGVSVQNLTKVFGKGKKKKKAVNDLSINFYENHITSFLGHNGAGKTTSVSMMTGMLPITSGKVYMYGRDIEKDFRVLRHDIAFCKQNNVLIGDLTVEEHFILFARLRNRSRKEAREDTRTLINDLGLNRKAKTPVQYLSGGMKRKVNVGMAFIGGPKIVFLDEPTAGIDPFARRSIWDLLIKYKTGRTIILTTHFLDEADLLGDRIAIISDGELQCYGSSLFLKSNLGRGYLLTIENGVRSEKKGRKLETGSPAEEMSVQAKQIQELIKKTIPDAAFLEEVGTELSFVLPIQSDFNAFDKLFKSLDDNKGRYNYTAYGISYTGLDEIFLKITEDAEAREDAKEREKEQEEKERKASAAFKKKQTGKVVVESFAEKDASPAKSGSVKKRDSVLRIAMEKNSCIIIFHQFVALITIRIYHHMRNIKLIIVEIVLPVLFMLIALGLTKMLPGVAPMPPVTIDISGYEPSIIYYSKTYPNNTNISAYEEALLGPYGMGPKCVASPQHCSLKPIPKASLANKERSENEERCHCDNDIFECPASVKNINPPYATMSSSDKLYNLTNSDLNSWLISKEKDLAVVRYGGVTLGHFSPCTNVSVLDFLDMFPGRELLLEIIASTLINNNTLPDVDSLVEKIMINVFKKPKATSIFQSKDLFNNIIIWFNSKGFIAVVAFMNAVSNLLLRALLPPEKDPSKYSITLVNHPLPFTHRQLEEEMEHESNASLLSAISVIWALSVIPATFVLYLVNDRANGFKHLQIVNGVSKAVYWITAFLWDFLIYTLVAAIIIGLYIALDMRAYIGEHSIKAFAVLLLAYGFAGITFVYPVSFFFATPSSSFIFISLYNMFVGLITLLTTFVLNLVSERDDPFYIYTIFMIFNQYCFGKSLMNLSLEDVKFQSFEYFGMRVVPNYFGWEITLKYIIAMMIQGCFFILVTFLMQYQCFSRFSDWRNARKFKEMDTKKKGRLEEEEDDVKRERERVESGKARDDGDAVIVNNLSKMYSRVDGPAVGHLSFGLKRGECFGLLGLNGAGKTTTFKMLTGYLAPSDGDALIAGHSIKNDKRQAKLLIGYCPQFDALDSYLTPEEHLAFFCRVRGITGSLQKEIVNELIKRLQLTKHGKKLSKSLSGGNKRKVNTAIALLGDPIVVLLDEPTSGMDARARRFLWNCILDVVQEGRCVILTSHSMEECQALCTQVSIMVSGKLMCFGSCTHLKQKYNEGYSVVVRCFTLDDVDKVKAHIEKVLPGSALLQVNYIQMRFRLAPDTSLGLAFRVLNQAKNDKLIQDYSLSQTTLESIFLNFARAGAVGQVESNTTCLRCLYRCKNRFKAHRIV